MDLVMVVLTRGVLVLGRGEKGHVASCELASLTADLRDLASQLCEHVCSCLRSHSERLRNLGGWGF